ncbi:MAG: hypothetical protein LBJ35_01050 [Spirochaetaceae bacterium]|jgi:hypothetical protein|nr:hypothetical protein [Spirochaetaceae bacterium]
MAKKCLTILVIAALAAGGIFAQEFGISVGAGGFIGGDFGGGVDIKVGGGGKMKMSSEIYSQDMDWSIMSRNIGILVKYPFLIDSKLLVFPLLGIDYQIVTSAKDKDGNYWRYYGDGGPGDFSALWFKLGGGLDFAVAEKLYLRFEALYGIRLANKYENDVKDLYESMGADATTRLGHGPAVKLAVRRDFALH